MHRTFILFAVFALSLAGYWLVNLEPSQTQPTVTLTVFAAASTIDAMDEILDFYHAELGQVAHFDRAGCPITTNVTVRANYASSSSLAMMIKNGAHADFLLSANLECAEQFDNRANLTRLLSNRMVVIKRGTDATPIKVTDIYGKVAMADPNHVPAGQYAKQFLKEAGQWGSVQPIATSDVRQVLAMIANGAADIGIVYATDAASAKESVSVVFEFSDPDVEVEYWMYSNLSKTNPIRGELASFLRSEVAASIFRKHGFIPNPR